MRKKILKNVDWGILICSIILCVIGMIALFSATQETGYSDLKKQMLWFIVSIPVILILIFVDYELIAKISPVFYGIFIILLVAVLFTEPINGATSWFEFKFFSLQPAGQATTRAANAGSPPETPAT